jgi:hypothetical protein
MVSKTITESPLCRVSARDAVAVEKTGLMSAFDKSLPILLSNRVRR